MAQRLLAYLIFAVLMTCSIAGSTVIVVLFYLPFVALKAVYVAVSGKVNPPAAADPKTS